MKIIILLLVLCSIASADTWTYSPIYARGHMDDDKALAHCKDVDVRIRHEAIVKNGNMRVTFGDGSMSLTMIEDGQDVTRIADEYDTGFGRWRFKSAKLGWHELRIFVWPGGGPNHEDRIYIGVIRVIDGVRCNEAWNGDAHKVTR